MRARARVPCVRVCKCAHVHARAPVSVGEGACAGEGARARICLGEGACAGAVRARLSVCARARAHPLVWGRARGQRLGGSETDLACPAPGGATRLTTPAVATGAGPKGRPPSSAVVVDFRVQLVRA